MVNQVSDSALSYFTGCICNMRRWWHAACRVFRRTFLWGWGSMDIGELLNKLDERKALIVHFSMRTNRNNNFFFPDDLNYAIAAKDCKARSCCVLWPGHPMDLPGDVGVIFRPSAIEQVLSVLDTDSGSYEVDGHPDQSKGKPFSRETYELTYQVEPNKYNEWRVKGADVIGIFVISPYSIQGKCLETLTLDGATYTTNGFKDFDICQVKEIFPGYPVYTMGRDGPVKI